MPSLPQVTKSPYPAIIQASMCSLGTSQTNNQGISAPAGPAASSAGLSVQLSPAPAGRTPPSHAPHAPATPLRMFADAVLNALVFHVDVPVGATTPAPVQGCCTQTYTQLLVLPLAGEQCAGLTNN